MQVLKITNQVAWHENDGPPKSWGVKMQDTKNAGHEMLPLSFSKVKS